MAQGSIRPRRLREKTLVRNLVRETTLAANDLMYPIFVVHGRGVRDAIRSMPGQSRLSVDELVKECKDVAGIGIPAGRLGCRAAAVPVRPARAQGPSRLRSLRRRRHRAAGGTGGEGHRARPARRYRRVLV